MKTLELVPPQPSEGVSLEGLERHYAARGIKVVWRAPQPSQGGPPLKLTGVPSQECPGCERSVVRHDRYWRRARLSMGRLGRFMDVCRKCEDDRAGYACRECREHRPQSAYRVVTTKATKTTRARICVHCERKPAEQRPVTCSRCGTASTRAETHKGWCKPCQAAYDAGRRAAQPRMGTCIGCHQSKPAADFPMAPSGARRRHYCTACYQAELDRLEQRCYSCKTVKPITQFVADARSPFGRKSICRKCASAVTAHKAKRRRAAMRQKEAPMRNT